LVATSDIAGNGWQEQWEEIDWLYVRGIKLASEIGFGCDGLKIWCNELEVGIGVGGTHVLSNSCRRFFSLQDVLKPSALEKATVGGSTDLSACPQRT
jgi:hypothetical protein